MESNRRERHRANNKLKNILKKTILCLKKKPAEELSPSILSNSKLSTKMIVTPNPKDTLRHHCKDCSSNLGSERSMDVQDQKQLFPKTVPKTN